MVGNKNKEGIGKPILFLCLRNEVTQCPIGIFDHLLLNISALWLEWYVIRQDIGRVIACRKHTNEEWLAFVQRRNGLNCFLVHQMVAHSEGTLDLAVRIVGLGDDFLYSVGIKEARNVVKLSIVCGKVEGLVSAVGKVVRQTAHLWHASGLHAVPVKECRVRKEGRIYSVVGVNAGGVSIFIAERQGKKFIKAWGEGALGIEVSAMLCRHSLHDNQNDICAFGKLQKAVGGFHFFDLFFPNLVCKGGRDQVQTAVGLFGSFFNAFEDDKGGV